VKYEQDVDYLWRKRGVTFYDSQYDIYYAKNLIIGKAGGFEVLSLDNWKKDIDRELNQTIFKVEFIRPLWSTDPWVPAHYVAGFFFMSVNIYES